MANELTSPEVTDLVVNDFTLSSGGRIVTPSSLLSDWDSIALGQIFADIRRDCSDKGFLMKTLSSRDLSDPQKVGKTVGSLADAIFGDLAPKPAQAAIRAAAFSLNQRLSNVTENLPLDSVAEAYMQGYKDATARVVHHVLRLHSETVKRQQPAKSMPKSRTTKRKLGQNAAKNSRKKR